MSPFSGGISFVPDVEATFFEYETIALSFIGWSLSEVRAMPIRERHYWLRVIEWRNERG